MINATKFSLGILKALILVPGLATAQSESLTKAIDDVQNKVQYFRMNSGVAAQLEGQMAQQFLELIDEQVQDIAAIKKRYQEQAEEIKRQSSSGVQQQLEALQELKAQQDKELLAVLLPHQADRMMCMTDYVIVLQEGLSNAMVYGSIAMRLELSVGDRRAVRDTAQDVLEEYEKAVAAAQKKAIAKLKESLPKDKIEAFEEIINPMCNGDGTLWPHPIDMLRVPEVNRTFAFPHLPPLDEE